MAAGAVILAVGGETSVASRQKYAGAPWLYDITTGDIIGVKDPDGSEFFWSRQERIGSFYDTTDQTNTANTAKVVTINTTDISAGVSIVSGSRITVDRAGVYNIQFSAQLENSDVADQDISVWFKKNGTDIDQSNTLVSVPSQHGGTPGHMVAAWNFWVSLSVTDYVEMYWSTTHTGTSIQAIPAQTGPVRPATPSVILTVNQVGA